MKSAFVLPTQHVSSFKLTCTSYVWLKDLPPLLTYWLVFAHLNRYYPMVRLPGSAHYAVYRPCTYMYLALNLLTRSGLKDLPPLLTYWLVFVQLIFYYFLLLLGSAHHVVCSPCTHISVSTTLVLSAFPMSIN